MKQMYKVFLNARVIEISSGKNITKNQPSVRFGDNCLKDEIIDWFNAFETSGIKAVSLVHVNPEWFFRQFQKAFLVIYAAGGIVLADNQLLMIFRQGKWDLPKGKLDGTETAEEAAMREVEEETGIRPTSIDHQLNSTYHIYKSPYPDTRGEWIFKETFWFQMNYSGKMTGTPQQEEGITQVKWISGSNLQMVLDNTYENLKQVLEIYRA